MARTRVNALADARLIVFECLRREFEAPERRRMTKRALEIVLAYERSLKLSKPAASIQRLPDDTKLRSASVRHRSERKFLLIILLKSFGRDRPFLAYRFISGASLVGARSEVCRIK